VGILFSCFLVDFWVAFEERGVVGGWVDLAVQLIRDVRLDGLKGSFGGLCKLL
jgi:hypothetical protein